MESLPELDRRRVARLLLKRFHPVAVKELSDELTPTELVQLADLDQERFACQWEIVSSIENDRRINRGILKKHVRDAIEPVLGNNPHQVGGVLWEYYTAIGPWTIVTVIDFGGNSFAMNYHHDLDDMRKREHQRTLHGHISAPQWLGVGTGEWSGLSDPDIPAAAEGLAFVCRRFVEALPDLLPTAR